MIESTSNALIRGRAVASASAAGVSDAAALVDRGAEVAFLAETSRCLGDSLDVQSTLEMAAGLALPHFGTWCMVDVVETEGSIRRLAVIHPDPAKQAAAREFYEAHPPGRDDPFGAPRVIRTSESEFITVGCDDVLADVTDEAQRALLCELGVTSFLMVPMRVRGRTLGAITFVADALRPYDGTDLLLAEDLGRRCAMALDNARLFRESHDLRVSAENALALADIAREDAAYAAQRADALRAAADAGRDEAEAANKSKANFLTTMSHEFRTPLGIVLGYVGLLNDEVAGPINNAQRKQLQRISTASTHLLRLIEEILTISKVDAGRGEPDFQMVDLSALLHDAVALLAPLAEAKRLALALDLPDGAIVFPTDAGKFRQIVFNLAANAVKFTKAGEVRISLRATETAVMLEVRDTGVGMTNVDAAKVFDSFWQVRPEGQRHPSGTGLGLSITRQLARLLGGDVAVESTPARGSTFTVTLPRPSDAIIRSLSTPASVARERRTHLDRGVAAALAAAEPRTPEPPRTVD